MGLFEHAIGETPHLWGKFHRKRLDLGGGGGINFKKFISIHRNKSPCCIQTRDLRVYRQRHTSSFGIINNFKMGWNRHFVSYCHKKVKVMGCWVPLIRMQKVRSFQYHVHSTTYTTTEDKHLIIGFFIVLDRFGILNLIKGLDNFRLRISKNQMERCQVAFWSFLAWRSAFFPWRYENLIIIFHHNSRTLIIISRCAATTPAPDRWSSIYVRS